MSKYEGRVTKNGRDEGCWIALIVRIYKDGEESVIHGYASRCFSTKEAGEKSVARYLAKMAARG